MRDPLQLTGINFKMPSLAFTVLTQVPPFTFSCPFSENAIHWLTLQKDVLSKRQHLQNLWFGIPNFLSQALLGA